MEMVLPFLLPKPEQQHILNLGAGKTSNYQGNHLLRSELRRLRSMAFWRSTPIAISVILKTIFRLN
jgi:hypothetical protein